MKIPNPWPNHPHIRFNVNNGECLASCGPGPEIEVPDMAVEVLIEPVDRGRYDSNPVAAGRVWSKEFGMLDVEDHLKKVGIKKEEQELKWRQEAERRRKQDEAKPKIFQEGNGEKDAPKEESKVLLKAVVKIDRESFKVAPKEEPKEKIEVARASSGMAKVTKSKK